MGNQSNEVAEIMKIIDQSQYDDEIIDGIEMGGLDLSFSDMSEVKADCMMAHHTNLRASSLIRVSLRDCEFNAANLESCNLEEADIADCVLSEANLRQAQMKYAEIRISTCIETCFDEVEFSFGNLAGTALIRATFRQANLTEISAEEAFFDEADLSKAILKDGNFKGSDFIDANLSEVDASNAIFVKANLNGAILSNGNFSGADFTNVTLENVVWKGANIDGAKFDNGVREEIDDILSGRRPKYNGETIEAHHSYSVMKYPHLANRGELLYPATKAEHWHRWHGRAWSRSKPGKPYNPDFPEEF